MMDVHARIVLFLCLFAGAVLIFAVMTKRNAPRTPRREHTILVLDMDETMIHSPPPHDRVIERPFVREFLNEMSSAFDELVVFTAATRDYASPILDRLDPTRTLFSRRFYRDSCSVDPRTGMFAKDLRILGNSLERTWILDNTPSAYALQPWCGIPILSFEGDPNDRELVKMAPFILMHTGVAASAEAA